MTSELSAFKKSLIIVISEFNEPIIENLLQGAQDSFVHYGGKNSDLIVYRVPGAFEIPVCAKHLIENNPNDALIALGVIIKGETDHADLVGTTVTTSLQNLALANNVPIIHEVLLTENREQAIERCQGDKNRGKEAARSAVTMAELFSSMNAIKDRKKSNSNG